MTIQQTLEQIEYHIDMAETADDVAEAVRNLIAAERLRLTLSPPTTGRCAECGAGPIVSSGYLAWASECCFNDGHPPVFVEKLAP